MLSPSLSSWKAQEGVELDGYKNFIRQKVIWKTIEIPIVTEWYVS